MKRSLLAVEPMGKDTSIDLSESLGLFGPQLMEILFQQRFLAEEVKSTSLVFWYGNFEHFGQLSYLQFSDVRPVALTLTRS